MKRHISLFFALSGILALFPSCTGEYPLKGSVMYRDPDTGAKGGLVFEPGKAPEGFVRVPIYDEETGELVGSAELSGPLSRQVDVASAK